MILSISGLVLILMGIIIAFRKIRYIIVCKRKVTGKVIDTVTESTSGDRSIKVKYVYNVKNEKYEGCTSWRNYGKYIIGGDILVKYNDKNPQESYLPGIDMVIKIMVGFLFAIVGCGVVLIGVLLKM